MNTYKIFLASSKEMKSDREQFEIFIGRKNNEWRKKGTYLELINWEYFLDCISIEGLQSEYNKAAKECDIFVMFFSTKVGKNTKEEFEKTFGIFQETKKPKIYTYFKNVSQLSGDINPKDYRSMKDFQDKLSRLGHYQTECKSIAEILLHFTQQLEKLVDRGFIKFDNIADAPPSPSLITSSILHDLTPPPFKPSYFIGREDELLKVHDKLFSDNPLLLLVNGEGGIGKTSLASEYYRRYKDEYKHIAWIVYGSSIAESLLSLHRYLDVVFEETTTTQERLDAIVTKMANLPSPSLLVIDNANDSEDLLKQYKILKCCTNFHILLTTRASDLPDIAQVKIESLNYNEALQVFQKHYPHHQASENELFASIWKAVGGNTQVIEILAKHINELNKKKTRYTLPDMLSDIQSKGLLQIKENEEMTTTKPTELISVMYDLEKLAPNPQEIQILSIFAVLPPERIEYGVLEKLIGNLPKLDAILDSLTQKGWLDFDHDSRSYKCSPVIQEIVKSKNPHLKEECRILIDSLLKQLDYNYISGLPINVSFSEAMLLTFYGESLVKSLKLDRYIESFLYDKMGRNYQATGNLTKAQKYYDSFNKLLSELYENNQDNIEYKYNLAISCSKLGEIYESFGSVTKALLYYSNEHMIFKELFAFKPKNFDYKNGFAISFQRLGDIAKAQNDLPKALENYTKFNQLEYELYVSYPLSGRYKNNLAISYLKLGEISEHQNDLPKALENYTKFNQLEYEFYVADKTNIENTNILAISFAKFGDIAKTQNDLPKALEHYTKFNQLENELYVAYPLSVRYKNNLGLSYAKLGDIAKAQKDLPKALEYYKKFNQLENELYVAYPLSVRYKNNLAESYFLIGNCFEKDKKNAITYFIQAEVLWEELVKSSPLIFQYKEYLDSVKKTIEDLGKA